ncbi:MAG: hypothetical protein JWO03_468 [Bacteroidetes bacterium]|nr:hypothetical protein [Bacteroidota bacterium]
MARTNYITRYSHINGKAIYVDGASVFERTSSGTDFLVEAYKGLGINYPKFYKMDNLCKLAILTVEVMLKDRKLNEEYKPSDIAVIASCANSSLDTDLRYQASTADAASPSLFVYTLPNVMIGEICIRHGIKGENTCFVSSEFDAVFQTDYVNGLLANDNAEICLSGWADYLGGEMNAFFMLVEKNPTSLGEHNTETVKQLYDRQWKN